MRPMLAGVVNDVAKIKFPVLTSPKYDGVRALIVNGVVLSRAMKAIPNRYVQHTFGLQELDGYDGELIIGPPTAEGVFNRTSSGVMRHDGSPDVRFYVFDNIAAHKSSLADRLTTIKPRHKLMQVVQYKRADCLEDLMRHEEEAVQEGYEGLIIRAPDHVYKFGRSTSTEGGMLKIKRFSDSEARVIAMTRLYHNNNPRFYNELGGLSRSHRQEGKIPTLMMGSLVVFDLVTGVEFDIGTGFTEKDRLKFWRGRNKLLGAIVKYKYQVIGVKNKPRFPVFMGFRDILDLS